MTIKFLLVEDDPNFLEIATSIITDLGSDVSVQVAKSRASAQEALENDNFDMIILDLKLPTIDHELAADVEHGRYVFEITRQFAPGTPVVILTGSPAESFIPDFLNRSTKADVWGDHTETSTLAFLKKADVDKLVNIIKPAVDSLRHVLDVEINQVGSKINLSWEQDRLIRIFVRRRSGVSCELHRISGGLSGASIFRISVRDDKGKQLEHSVIKIGSPKMVDCEVQNYKQYANRLNERATARLIEDIRFGACRSAAITYRLAETFTRTIFDAIKSNDARLEASIKQVAEAIEPWRSDVPQARMKIADVRRRIVSDEKAKRVWDLFGLEWASAFEERKVQIRWCCIHGDFHGCNILLDADGSPIIIDYGDMGDGPASLDWVTLELSTLFHPQGPARDTKWPDIATCASWSDIRAFAGSSPFNQAIETTREMSVAAAAGQREIAVAAYCYVLRQLSYEDTDKERGLSLLHGFKSFIENST